jgi:hypothetical protein
LSTSSLGGVAVYYGLLKDELAAQDARKASFEQRGLAVVTTAGALASLVFGLAAFASTGKTHPLPQDTRELLVLALAVFVAAGVLAILTNLPIVYRVPKPAQLHRRAQQDENEIDALRWVAGVYEGMLTDAKRKNKCKGELLFGALTLEIAAVIILTIATAHAF